MPNPRVQCYFELLGNYSSALSILTLLLTVRAWLRNVILGKKMFPD